MCEITWKTRECGDITDCLIRYKGYFLTVPFEHPYKMPINDPLNCLGYLLNAVAVYENSSLEEQIRERFGEPSKISHEDYLRAVEIWEIYRHGYNGMHEMFTDDELELLNEIVPCI